MIAVPALEETSRLKTGMKEAKPLHGTVLTAKGEPRAVLDGDALRWRIERFCHALKGAGAHRGSPPR